MIGTGGERSLKVEVVIVAVSAGVRTGRTSAACSFLTDITDLRGIAAAVTTTAADCSHTVTTSNKQVSAPEKSDSKGASAAATVAVSSRTRPTARRVSS